MVLVFSSYDIIILTETWLSPKIFNSELSLDRFHIVCIDRYRYILLTVHIQEEVGVLIAVNTLLNAGHINYCVNAVEKVFVILTFSFYSIIVGAVYLPPSSILPVFKVHTSSEEQLILSVNPSSIHICGNSNLAHLK